ncbi:H/ACA ribonucleoprotein complex subunit NHP2 [Phytophthora citrophthora]|uniref:H/ACA ribonucleoprotein complex subunit NHP2 n=1 Tax=Phytophthora citrophthora TaxID=4793 RepID=A0AAD9G240_9STRA|nr:H/ACA ribonucleoprotein complex subunit NHP2 [Phytophthora citrophthora]
MSDTEGSKKSSNYEERVKHVSVIAKPLATKKQTKHAYKVVKKATKVKGIKRGVKEVVKGIRKGEKGVCIIAGDISPVDVISHIPVLCEENDIPYIFTPSKVLYCFYIIFFYNFILIILLLHFQVDLGASALSKRPTSCILITPNKAGFNAQDVYDKLLEEVKEVQPTY